ncbi:MAG TPA: hypothetical protein VNO30_20085 [Kofleriaceae bacterium]|nr:hypothetical protein [Kofleriaceae bacterium]
MNYQTTLFDTSNSLIVSTLDVSPDGRWLVVGQQGDDTTQIALGVWSMESKALEDVLIRSEYDIPLAARFSPDSKLLAFSDMNQDLTIKDLASGASDQHSFSLRFTKWLSFAWNCNRLIAGGSRTQVWDPDLRTVVFTLPVEPLPDKPSITPPCCALSPDGQHVAASGIEPGRILIYEVTRGEVVSRIENTMDDARSMAFDPSGRFLAATARLGGAGLWNVETGEAVLPDLLNMRADYYWCVRFHPNGEHVGFGLWSGFVNVIRIADGDYAVTQDKPIHQGRVNDIAFTRNGKHMVTGGDDGVVLVWELR